MVYLKRLASDRGTDRLLCMHVGSCYGFFSTPTDQTNSTEETWKRIYVREGFSRALG